MPSCFLWPEPLSRGYSSFVRILSDRLLQSIYELATGGAKLDVQENEGRTAIMEAATHRAWSVSFLTVGKRDVSSCFVWRLPLFVRSEFLHGNRVCVGAGGPIICRRHCFFAIDLGLSFTALLAACPRDAVRVLVELGADMAKTDEEGSTVLAATPQDDRSDLQAALRDGIERRTLLTLGLIPQLQHPDRLHNSRFWRTLIGYCAPLSLLSHSAPVTLPAPVQTIQCGEMTIAQPPVRSEAESRSKRRRRRRKRRRAHHR